MTAYIDSQAERVEYEMGYAADEFGKVLLGSFTGDRTDFNAVETGRHRWLVTRVGSAFELEIEVADRPPRQIGLFALPVLQVRFRFDRSEAAEREQFFNRFQQYFHKGGG